MSKYNKVTYCKSCGASNKWNLNSKNSLLEKPKFCCSCGCNLVTGQKAKVEKRKKEDLEGAFEEEEEPYTPLPSNIPPLELDEEACYFPKTDSQSLGNLVSPILKEDEVEDSANAS
jgi:hypothetical protein